MDANLAFDFVVMCLLLSCQMCTSHTDTDNCGNSYFGTQERAIIRTEDSVANGAVVLKTQHTTSEKICKLICCKLHGCNVAVFETTTKNLCYLFNCGKDAKLCDFEQHNRYTVSIKMTKAHSQGKSGLNIREMTPKPLSTLPSAMKGARTQPIRAATQLASGRHQCRYPEAQFACRDATKSPSCVAIYDRCDGVPQCGDSSDEADCPAAAAAAAAAEPKQQRSRTPGHTGRVSEHHMQSAPSPAPVMAAAADDDVTNGLWDNHMGRGGMASLANTIYNSDDEDEVDEVAGSSSPVRSSPPTGSHVDSKGDRAVVSTAAGIIEFAAPTESPLVERYRRSRATVIGLGAALAVTLLAIVVLGCRLRQLRSRVARGGGGKLRSRALDDEDYLINGMYL